MLAGAAGVVLLVLGCAAATLVPAGTHRLTILGTVAWAWLGPYLVLGSLAAFLVALRAAAVHRRAGRATAAFALLALILSGAITLAIMRAAWLGGGTADPVQALWRAGEDGVDAPPDLVETVAEPDGEALRAAIYRPRRDGAAAPVILYIHGGGWVGGSALWGADAVWFARRGYLVVSAEYRLARPDRPTWNLAPLDVACALAWTARNAARWGGDPARIVLLGDSAGGNLAVNLGWSAARGQAPGGCGTVPVPRAIVVQYPVLDPAHAHAQGRPWLDGEGPQGFVAAYVGGPPGAHPDRMAAIAAATHVSAQAPPTLVLQPDRDDYIPAEGNDRVVALARSGGVDVTVLRIPFAHHAYDLLPGSLGRQLRRTVTEAWLRGRGLAP